MPIQVAAHNFELTEGLKANVLNETKDKLQPLAVNNFTAKWTLSLDAGEHVAHVTWTDGQLRGDATTKTEDMYSTIHQCVKKAAEQIKKAHGKRFDKRTQSSHPHNLEEEVVETEL